MTLSHVLGVTRFATSRRVKWLSGWSGYSRSPTGAAPGADPGFRERGGSDNTGGGYDRGRAPPVTARGYGGAKPQPLFCFYVY